jgi:hypothetical protein
MQQRILLDSCAYFRLARGIIPLLNIEFGPEKFCLCILQELEEEYNKSPRLKNKFDWVMEPEHVEERQNTIQIKGKEFHDIETAHSFIEEIAKQKDLSLSWVDIRALATAYILKITLVTDDNGIIELGSEIGIKSINSLGLIQLMFVCNHIKYGKIKQIVSCWDYENELPMGKNKFIAEYKKILDRMYEMNFSGGIVYDAIIVQVAEKETIDHLLTFNEKHFLRIWPEGIKKIKVP